MIYSYVRIAYAHTKNRKVFTTNLGVVCVYEWDPAGGSRLGGGEIQVRGGEEAGMEVRGVSKVERSAELEDLHAGHLHRLTERRGRSMADRAQDIMFVFELSELSLRIWF